MYQHVAHAREARIHTLVQALGAQGRRVEDNTASTLCRGGGGWDLTLKEARSILATPFATRELGISLKVMETVLL